jgi:hypothetical protein
MPALIQRKVGRPPSGKKQYCIRMRQGTYVRLLQQAKRAGFPHVGDFIDELLSRPDVGRIVRQLETNYKSGQT